VVTAAREKPASSRLRRPAAQTFLALLVLALFWVAFYSSIWRGHEFIGYDLLRFNYPLDRFIFQHVGLHHGLPLFDPFTYNGIDFVGNIQSELFYPPKLLMDLGLKAAGMRLTFSMYTGFLLLHVLIFSVSIYLVGKRLTKSWWLSILAALTLAYAGFFQGQLEHLWYFTTLAWAPLAYYGLDRGLREERTSGTVIYIISSVFMLLAGYPLLFLALQILIVGGVLVSDVVNGRLPTVRTIGRLALAWVIVLFLAAPAVLPFLALLRSAVADISRPSFSPRVLLTGFAPNSLGGLSGDFNLAGSDITNSYYFSGIVFFAFPIAAFYLARQRDRVSRRALFALVTSLAVCSVIVFTPLTSRVGALRSWMFAGVIVVLLFVLVAYSATLAFRAGRGHRIAIITLGVISIAFVYRYNRPGAFNALPGSARAPSNQNFVIGDARLMATIEADSPTYSILVDSGVVRGNFEGWPRVAMTRSVSGFDPTVQRPYMSTLYRSAALGGRPVRLVIISKSPNLKWLADNGIKYIVSSADKFPLLSNGPKVVFRSDSYDILELPRPRALLSSDGCATISDVALDTTSLSFTATARAAGCMVRATSNYSSNWRPSDPRVRLAPVANALGFTIGPLPPGSHRFVLRYRNRAFDLGLLLLVVGVVMLSAFVWTSARRRGRPSGIAQTSAGSSDVPASGPDGVSGKEP